MANENTSKTKKLSERMSVTVTNCNPELIRDLESVLNNGGSPAKRLVNLAFLGVASLKNGINNHTNDNTQILSNQLNETTEDIPEETSIVVKGLMGNYSESEDNN